MMKSPHSSKELAGRWLDVEEVRLISDLRIMHSKVAELRNLVANLKQRHHEADIVKYADTRFSRKTYARWTKSTCGSSKLRK